MASRLSRTAFARLARPAARVGRNTPRRGMSSGGTHSEGSDKPWIIGSALVFGPAIAYLLSPSSQKQAHHAQQHSLPKEKESNPENAPVPPTPAPQEVAPKEESKPENGIADDEGNVASNKEVADSVNKGVEDDDPKGVQAAEPSTSEQSEGDKAITEKAEPAESAEPPEPPKSEEKKSEEKTEESPSDIGDARQDAKGGKAPKESSESK